MSSSLIPTPADVEYQEAHIHESRQHEVVASNVAVLTLATVAVILRLVARRITKAPLQKDDYTIIVALVRTLHSRVLVSRIREANQLSRRCRF